MFSYPCPYCSQRLLAPDDRIGQRTLCPKCLRPLVIPAPDPDDDPAGGVGGPAVDLPAPVLVPPDETTADAVTPSPLPRPAARPGPVFRPSALTPRPVRVSAPVAARTAVADAAPGVGVVDLAPPPLPTGLDLAAELTAALTMRMKPPPEPPGDLRVSTGAWLVLSAAAVTLWVAGVLYHPDSLPFVTLIGAVLVLAGYLWGAVLAGRDRPLWGVLNLVLPPVAAVRLCRPYGSDGFRPLRLVASGLLFVALGYFGPAARTALGPMAAAWSGARPVVAGPTGPVAELRADRERRPPEPLVARLTALAKPDARKAVPAEYHGALVGEVRALTGDDRPEVRAAAVRVLAAWSPADAREPVLAALGSADGPERRAALALAPRFPDPEVARAVAARFGERDERPFVKEALVRIGPPAEAATLPLLATDQQLLVMDVFEVLDKVGGPATVDALRRLAAAGGDPIVREAARQKADSIGERLAGKK